MAGPDLRRMRNTGILDRVVGSRSPRARGTSANGSGLNLNALAQYYYCGIIRIDTSNHIGLSRP